MHILSRFPQDDSKVAPLPLPKAWYSKKGLNANTTRGLYVIYNYWFQTFEDIQVDILYSDKWQTLTTVFELYCVLN